jgi:hypothetical protein
MMIQVHMSGLGDFNISSDLTSNSPIISLFTAIVGNTRTITTVISLFVILLILTYIYPISSYNPTNISLITTYFYPNWTTEFKLMTDIETLAHMIYIAYPTA